MMRRLHQIHMYIEKGNKHIQYAILFSCLGKITHCRDDKDETWHPIGSSWRNSDCMDCTCNSCCSGYATPVDFPDDCMKKWDQKACEFKVVKKRDPSISCPIFASVGNMHPPQYRKKT
uniref:Uncharacterized protein n=1 Tax=Oncorhynchus tshawytscha TaxID=74940 RepID=A0AAZ3PKJ3_ONCTS